ncbi:MAG TPA: Zn-dependent alcohol dehydrogenase [Candidatus Binataceae bacterium]|jgi:S-(hydroxymethyl)glutathione dehydrogenase/alcohol dehydrogenase|nr:Zn-dependent alcohol dehydrogenase [Candidatus Binataceae bacterium]
MKAAIFQGAQKPLTIEQIDIDEPQEHEVLLRMVATGVCHSDLHFTEGLWPHPAPAVLGHEGAGIVDKVGKAVTYVKPGDHVISCVSVFCGHCDQCLSGHPNLCVNNGTGMRGKNEKPRLSQNGKPIHTLATLGTFAEKMLVHENALVKITEQIGLDRAALIGCGVTTGVGAVLNTAKIEPGSDVVVFGCGGVGISAIQGARIAGAGRIFAVDQFENKLAMARKFGATHTIDASQSDPVKEIKSLTGGRGADYSFEAVGLKKLAEQCFECIRPGGTATIIGMIPFGQKVELDGAMFLSERKIQGTLMGSNRFRIDMPRYINFYLDGRLNLDDMISRRGKIEDINEAFRAMKAGEVARSVLMFE